MLFLPAPEVPCRPCTEEPFKRKIVLPASEKTLSVVCFPKGDSIILLLKRRVSENEFYGYELFFHGLFS